MTSDFIVMISSVYILVTAGVFYYLYKSYDDYAGRIIFVGMIWGCGPRLFGYSFIDEISFLGLFAFLAFFHRSLIVEIWQECKSSLSFKIASILCGFLVLQSIRGAFVLDDWRMIKWVFTFAALPFVLQIFMGFVRASDYDDHLKRCFISLVIFSYFAAYAVQGLLAESYLGLNGRFATQHYVWQGSALAVMPCIIYTFLSCKWLKGGANSTQKILILVNYVMMSFCSFYFDSRILQLLLILFLFCAFFHASRAKLLWSSLLLVLGLSFIVNTLVYDPNLLQSLSFESGSGGQNIAFSNVISNFKLILSKTFEGFADVVKSANIVNPAKNDFDRALQLKAAFDAVLENPKRLLIGDGFYVHRYTLTPFVVKSFESGLQTVSVLPGDIPFDPQNPVFRTTGLAGILVDVGLAGVVLVCFLFWKQLQVARRQNNVVMLMTIIKTITVLSLSYVAFTPENMLIFVFAFPLFLPGEYEHNDLDSSSESLKV